MCIIRNLRKAAGMTQSQLAIAAGLSQPYICQLENGRKQNPPKETIERLARALGVMPARIIEGVRTA